MEDIFMTAQGYVILTQCLAAELGSELSAPDSESLVFCVVLSIDRLFLSP